ncbi:MAG: twin-arginine translocase subunit TatC [Actinobacteria bacterium]|nr:twin-arginine translocase subunit TatC [Actinomycetota bacterium]
MKAKPSRQASEVENDQSRMSFSDHIEELRGRLIKALIGIGMASAICLYFGDAILTFIRRPLEAALLEYGHQPQLISLSPVEFFNVYIRVGLLCGLMLASPWVLYQIWSFVAAGLHKHEKKWVLIFGPASLVLFVAGLACLYYAVLPLTLRFFLRFGEGMATPMFAWSFYISMVLSFALGFGIGFQTPLVVIFLALSGLVPVSQLKHMRKFIIVGVLTLAAILTPPDWQSQMLLALPMLGLFELGLLTARLMVRRQDRH